jgi:hypothetical protein
MFRKRHIMYFFKVKFSLLHRFFSPEIWKIQNDFIYLKLSHLNNGIKPVAARRPGRVFTFKSVIYEKKN